MPKMALTNHSLTILHGKDALKLVNGLSSNKVDTLKNNEVASTIILNKKAKIIDFIQIFSLNKLVIMIGNMINRQKLCEEIQDKILSQDVKIQDITHLNNVSIIFDTKLDTEPNSVITIDNKTIVNIEGRYCYEIKSTSIVDTDEYVSEEIFNHWRIENLVPWYGYEFHEGKNPYRCGLRNYVHENKGCYTGQEILTRMRTRQNGIFELVRVKNIDDSKITISTKGERYCLGLKRVQ